MYSCIITPIRCVSSTAGMNANLNGTVSRSANRALVMTIAQPCVSHTECRLPRRAFALLIVSYAGILAQREAASQLIQARMGITEVRIRANEGAEVVNVRRREILDRARKVDAAGVFDSELLRRFDVQDSSLIVDGDDTTKHDHVVADSRKRNGAEGFCADVALRSRNSCVADEEVQSTVRRCVADLFVGF